MFLRPDHRHTEVIQEWAEKWRSLKTWGKSLTCGLRVLGRHPDRRMGDCAEDGQLVRIYDSGSITDDLSTILHEYAHVVTTGVPEPGGHSLQWRLAFGRAVREVTGAEIPAEPRTRDSMDSWADRAMWNWWCENGFDLAHKLGSGGIHHDREVNRLWAAAHRNMTKVDYVMLRTFGVPMSVKSRVHDLDWTGWMVTEEP